MANLTVSLAGLNGLNESPSEKEGKFPAKPPVNVAGGGASMKALPKRKGNNNCPYPIPFEAVPQ